jgi:hypothetical protein
VKELGRRLLLPLLVLAVAAIALSVALFARGRGAIRESDEALARADYPVAIVLAKRAAQARVWGSPYPEQGYERLFAIAHAREAANDETTARVAYRAVISAARASGDVALPHVTEARQALAKLEGTKGTETEPGLPAPSDSTRALFAISVLLVACGLGWFVRSGNRGAWIVFAVGVIGIAVVALR